MNRHRLDTVFEVQRLKRFKVFCSSRTVLSRSQHAVSDTEVLQLNKSPVEPATTQHTPPDTCVTESIALSHVDQHGKASMVDVGQKAATLRVAKASGKVVLGRDAYGLVASNSMKKGDVLTTAQLAGIMGAKQTSSLIPLCHNIPLSKVRVDLRLLPDLFAVVVEAEARTQGQTGVEMEALTAVSVAALTVYDMCKAVSKDIRVTDVQLDAKVGGKSGAFTRPITS